MQLVRHVAPGLLGGHIGLSADQSPVPGVELRPGRVRLRDEVECADGGTECEESLADRSADAAAACATSIAPPSIAQKGGAVVSDIKFSSADAGLSNKLATGECDLFLGCDVLVAVDDAYLSVATPDRTVGVLNTAKIATGHMVASVKNTFPDLDGLAHLFEDQVSPDPQLLDTREIVLGLFGQDQDVNMLLVGVAYQTGVTPLPAEAIEEAIRLNGLAVDTNLQAFRYGRLWVQDRAAVEAEVVRRRAAPDRVDEMAGLATGLDGLVRRQAAELTAYRDASYAGPLPGLHRAGA